MKKLLLILTSLLFIMCSDPCDAVTCQNGATCDDGTCICTENFSGANCETRDCFTCTKEGEVTVRVCKDDFPGDILDVQFNASVSGWEAVGFLCE